MHRYTSPIQNGKLVRSSVSQLTLWQSCPRKWWYKYVGGIPEPEYEAFKEGKARHKKFEEHFKGHNHVFEEAEAEALTELIPSRNLVPRAEQELTQLDLAGMPFQGSMDLVWENNVYDYKFQSRVTRFRQPNPQVWGYLEELRRLRGYPKYAFHFILIPKKGGKPVKETFEYTAQEVEAGWKSYAPLIEEMRLAVDKKPEQLLAETGTCYKYGRPCPYIGICERNTMSFLDELNKAKAAVELPDPDEPTESEKAKALAEIQGFDSDDYARPPKKDDKKSIRPPEVRIKTVEVRHSVTLDIKRDGIFSASIGLGLTADLDGEDEGAVREELSKKILTAIHKEAERYKK